jgi:undecaprenyl-diphosphatase
VPIVLAGLILSSLVMLLFGGTEIDRGLLLLFGSGDAPGLREAARIVVSGALPTPLLAAIMAAAAYLFIRSRWRQALILLGITLIGRLLVDGLQEVTEGLRPAVNERLLRSQQPGYPSGHAANATITGFSIAFLATRHYPFRALALALAAALALTVGAGRLVLGASWPSDVIGGWALGIAWTLLLLKLAKEDMGDGTARPLRHSLHKGESHGKPQDRNRAPDGRQRSD